MKKLAFIDNIITLVRLLAVVAIICVPVWRFLLPPEAIDPMWLRLVLTGYFLLFLICTYVWPFFREKIIHFIYFTTLLVSVWYLVLVYLNHLSTEYAIAYFLVLFICGIIYQDRLWLLIYIGLNLVLTLAIFPWAKDPQIDILNFISMEGFFLLTIFLNISFRIRSKEQLEAKEAHYREITQAAFESTKDGILVVDNDRTITEVNSRFKEIWGKGDDILGKSGKQDALLSAEEQLVDPEAFLRLADEAHLNKSKSTFDTLEFKDGRIFERYSLPLKPGNEIRGRLWYLTDVTEKKIREKELLENLAIIQATFEATEMGILVVDPRGQVKTFNDRYLEMWGLEADYLQNQDAFMVREYCWSKLAEPEIAREHVRKIIAGEISGESFILKFKDGRIVERFTHKLFRQDQELGRVWFYLDITDRETKRLELLQRNFELDSFVYRASHDLKAPLNSIMGLISILQSEAKNQVVDTYVTMMNKSVLKLDTFIRNLADFSRNARLEITREPVSIKNTIEEAIESLRYMDNADKVSIECELSPDLVINTDPVRLSIVVTNLISNAIKYQDLQKENRFVRIQAQTTPENHMLTVEDNGIGIPADHQEKIFDLFVRASVQSYGSGIGLYITKNAVERMGGQLSFQSVPGQGTTFTLTLPN
ncbi:MAG: PAS domain-containing protein [Bacteroidia bacterium]|nr:PAS domain-containing protein [Bacteroidia bacterium]